MGREYRDCITLAPFRTLCYINHRLYVPGDTIQEPVGSRKMRKKNVEFYQERSQDSASDLASLRFLTIRSKQNNDYVEKLYVN